jgi:hypothetical protein
VRRFNATSFNQDPSIWDIGSRRLSTVCLTAQHHSVHPVDLSRVDPRPLVSILTVNMFRFYYRYSADLLIKCEVASELHRYTQRKPVRVSSLCAVFRAVLLVATEL